MQNILKETKRKLPNLTKRLMIGLVLKNQEYRLVFTMTYKSKMQKVEPSLETQITEYGSGLVRQPQPWEVS